MAPARSLPDEPMTIAEALAALRIATRARHAALLGSPEHRLAAAEESRLTKLIWRTTER